MAAKGNWTKSLFIGLWTVLNFTRKLFFNVIFLVIFVGIIIAITSQEDDQLTVKANSALLLTLNGQLVIEKESVDPFEQFLQDAMGSEPDNPEVLVRDVVKVIENAKQDRRIKALVLDLQGLSGGGLDKLRTVARAINDFKTSEKPVYAIGDYYTKEQYYLASHANHVYLNPMGSLLLDGYGRYGMYFKDFLEKLKVTTHIFRVGTYKSAVEPLIRNDMSEAAKEAERKWLDGYWQQYKEDVAAARGIPLSNFDETLEGLLAKFEQAGGDFANYALQNNWVDALKTREEVRVELTGLVGENEDNHGVNVTNFNTYLKVVNPPLPSINSDIDKVAIVVAKGTILNGNQKAGTIGGDSTARLLRKARLDENVKAVVLQIDSPGGSTLGSEIIRQEVLELKNAGKPVVVSMSTYAASGGYWIAANADRIFASPSTITGSIGVFGMFMTYENSLDYLGIHSDGVGSNELAGFSAVRPLAPEFGQILQRNVETSYGNFLSLVSNARDMTVDEVDDVAQGRVWIGTDALELGLVDELGTLEDAVNAAAEFAALENYDTFYVQRTLSAQELFWKEFFGQAFTFVGKWQFANSDSALINEFKRVLGEFSIFNELNDPMGTYILCLQCQVE
ncbi:signal peptide peptidase SppA [Alteromonas sp. KS69]|jgi:protease-4|uniref:Signal peptide peptidase SppA, 67K type n=1 Tax=Alteromonas naphthalenivorans TaxID=715451 RepID=F5Z8Q5_ALTNA|nr:MULTISPECIES: signal peptide peptidase SppA [Alteromonas]AEF03448.1 signal peptide peptidase SppA, 67K type [Alteromonas naphthalenivorans]MBB66645.1 signal peptide peptidase SppA [Rickettsiales bacterium]MBO7922441.1 signal peptide peptidase SppA [Alteromonas sp. K632G]RUP81955.1 signal peptide peptidase SppA [Alteromonas sp. KS69]|tara:strand:+ start:2023 stop:3888 length:1866 start_codon:yes stop_codon:yes gene_type:complete